ncbi:calcineurin-like phosphoesterase family protein [Actinoalloteichus hoggarensis]|uniref:Calcineurin-like phosphoesterase n=1 Tax=Actinoalloteichus hoggarensis TaxID=1470176 RepID=A0A221VYD8_9PSEU|nr:metallophosphoesterase [Actinoalloteichus hoggarensis]ASO18556.1 Calcineurin-like phosphoesterase [Actinoalloteichus hoggarensis]MBB5921924.1 calcineurin-like phosphoesterase family protein [Actinoalloteichus hoggarensis]
MVRVLAVADEVVERFWSTDLRGLGAELILGAGDLPFDYLAYLGDRLEVPCVFVPGNHDRDLTGYRRRRGLWLRAGMPVVWPGPPGAVNADGRVVDVAGLRIAGLGGSIRYRPGPNQWTEREQASRGRRLSRLAALRRLRDGGGVDVLLTHAPPRDCGDREDPPHRGFRSLHTTVRRLRPRLLVHGHIHPFGEPVPDRELHGTRVVNAVGCRILDVPGGSRPRGKESPDAP